MEPILRFTESSFHKFNLAEYVNTSDRFATVTQANGAEVLHYKAADMERYNELLGKLQDNLARSMATAETAELLALDEQRDVLGRYIIDTVRASQNLPNKTKSDAATKLYLVLKPYEGFYKIANMQETATLNGMVLDLNKDANKAYVETLGLQAEVDELTAVNAQYKVLTDSRTITREGAKAEDSKTIRAEMDQLYDYITTVAFAHNVITPSSQLANYITQVNAIIDEANTSYKQRMAQTKAKGEDEAEGETTA